MGKQPQFRPDRKNKKIYYKVPHNRFSCPICGNELIESKRDYIVCQWCHTKIVPKYKRYNRQETTFSED